MHVVGVDANPQRAAVAGVPRLDAHGQQEKRHIRFGVARIDLCFDEPPQLLDDARIDLGDSCSDLAPPDAQIVRVLPCAGGPCVVAEPGEPPRFGGRRRHCLRCIAQLRPRTVCIGTE